MAIVCWLQRPFTYKGQAQGDLADDDKRRAEGKTDRAKGDINDIRASAAAHMRRAPLGLDRRVLELVRCRRGRIRHARRKRMTLQGRRSCALTVNDETLTRAAQSVRPA